MKPKLIISMVLLMLFGVITDGYSRPKPNRMPNYPAKAINKLITKSVSYPDFGYEKDLSGTVDILFILSADGRMIIKRITSENQELTNYVRQMLSGLDFNRIDYPIGELYQITLSFYPE